MASVITIDENGMFAGVWASRPDGSIDLPSNLTILPSGTPEPEVYPARWAGVGWDYSSALPDIRAAARERLRELIDEIVAPIRNAYSDTEVRTWDQQSAEAEALLADERAPAPMIRAIAKELGRDPVDYARGVKAKADAYLALGAAAVAARQVGDAGISSATTPKEVWSILDTAVDKVRVAAQTLGAA